MTANLLDDVGHWVAGRRRQRTVVRGCNSFAPDRRASIPGPELHRLRPTHPVGDGHLDHDKPRS